MWQTQARLNVTWRNDLAYAWLAAAARSYRKVPRGKIGGPQSVSVCIHVVDVLVSCRIHVVGLNCRVENLIGSDRRLSSALAQSCPIQFISLVVE
nr:hypothetical protein Itr_chr11CG07650 [Ipomoea trifida]